MRRYIIAFISFIIGMALFLPSETLFKYATERAVSRYNLPLNYHIEKARFLSANYKDIRLSLPGQDIVIPEMRLRITPLGYITEGTIGFIHSRGLEGTFKSIKGNYIIALKMTNFKNPALNNIPLKGTVRIEIAKKDPKSGSIKIDVSDLRLPFQGNTVTFKKVSGVGRFQKGRITIEDLRISGPMNMGVRGFLVPNLKAFERSNIDLDMVIESDGNKVDQKIRGQLQNLLQFVR